MSLRCLRLNKAFGGVQALRNFDSIFHSSQITAIVGPNGAGKTTLLNVITGYLQCDSGICALGETALTGLAPYRIAQLGVARTFQDIRLIREASCLENVLLAMPGQLGEKLGHAVLNLGVRAQEEANRHEALRLLQLVGLDGVRDQSTDELSYGQQKLLALTSCVAMRAKVLLLDEPVAGVHASVAAVVHSMLREFRSEGKLVIFIEHDFGTVRSLADNVIVMDGGSAIAQGPPLEVLKRPEVMEAFIG